MRRRQNPCDWAVPTGPVEGCSGYPGPVRRVERPVSARASWSQQEAAFAPPLEHLPHGRSLNRLSPPGGRTASNREGAPWPKSFSGWERRTPRSSTWVQISGRTTRAETSQIRSSLGSMARCTPIKTSSNILFPKPRTSSIPRCTPPSTSGCRPRSQCSSNGSQPLLPMLW
jgi:hypothetical protein